MKGQEVLERRCRLLQGRDQVRAAESQQWASLAGVVTRCWLWAPRMRASREPRQHSRGVGLTSRRPGAWCEQWACHPMCDSEEWRHPEPSKCPELREASEAPEKQLAAQSRDPSETAWGLRGGWGSRAWGQEQGRAGGGQGATWVPGGMTLGICFPSHPTQQLRMLVGICESVCL